MKRYVRLETLALLLSMAFSVSTVRSQETETTSEQKAETQLRRAYLGDLAKQYTLTVESMETPLAFTEDALLFYSNPTKELGSTHGSTFLWLDGKRPLAACSFSIRRPNNSVGLEFSSFTEKTLECRRQGRLTWRPDRWNCEPLSITGAPAPASQASHRLVQMRALARQFDARCFDRRSGEATDLRLLPQPLYRYSDSDKGISDGAIFAYVISNDPELLLRLEAIESGGDLVWQGSFARMTSRQIEVTKDGTKVWEIENFYDKGRAYDRPYLETRAETSLGFDLFQQRQARE
ncbi:hypothetical protein [Roseiconus lacunae]|uniref:hypothetical protein n=1 Tax=Roseiconus lacunae TaxID=2605694 RepID=UPI0011F1F40D|nr:hypothetical protein [Roseiconus lacunae]MCD0462460.1 hypothetical protein [Roseiconus lacunae]